MLGLIERFFKALYTHRSLTKLEGNPIKDTLSEKDKICPKFSISALQLLHFIMALPLEIHQLGLS